MALQLISGSSFSISEFRLIRKLKHFRLVCLESNFRLDKWSSFCSPGAYVATDL